LFQHVTYLQCQNVRQAWLHEETIAAGGLGLVLESTKCMAREDDDSGRARSRVATDSTREVKARHTSETHVGDDDVGLDPTRVVEAIVCSSRVTG
jgi:hypothetical protein